MSDQPRVSIKNLRKVFVDPSSGRETVAVESFSLDIRAGELVTLLGPSGCGKTTVLRMLAGFEPPTSGEIFQNGKNITTLPPNKRDSAMVFQSYALFPHMSVKENICYGLKLRGVDANSMNERFKRMSEVAGLAGFDNRKPHELSGGQQQRVALARALIVEPIILLFDEPLSNLDAKLRESMRNEIRRIQQKMSITAVYVTHDQSEAMAISDRVVVMNKAKIEQTGRPQEIYLRPSSSFVADFMGAANVLNAEVTSSSGSDLTLSSLGYNFSGKSSLPRSVGEQISVVVRPEHVRASTSGPGLRAKILESHYLGAYYSIEFELENGKSFRGQFSIQDFDSLSSSKELFLSFDPFFVHAL